SGRPITDAPTIGTTDWAIRGSTCTMALAAPFARSAFARSAFDGQGELMERRVFLKTGLGTMAATTIGGWARRSASAAAPDEAKWRAFEVVTRAEVANPTGATRV